MHAEAESMQQHVLAISGRLHANLVAALGAENVRVNGPAARELSGGGHISGTLLPHADGGGQRISYIIS